MVIVKERRVVRAATLIILCDTHDKGSPRHAIQKQASVIAGVLTSTDMR